MCMSLIRLIGQLHTHIWVHISLEMCFALQNLNGTLCCKWGGGGGGGVR